MARSFWEQAHANDHTIREGAPWQRVSPRGGSELRCANTVAVGQCEAGSRSVSTLKDAARAPAWAPSTPGGRGWGGCCCYFLSRV